MTAKLHVLTQGTVFQNAQCTHRLMHADKDDTALELAQAKCVHDKHALCYICLVDGQVARKCILFARDD